MNTLIALCVLALLPVSMGITCYSCTGCGDPFSTSTYGSSTVTGQAVCYKTTASGVATIRGGYTSSSLCVAASVLGYGTFCCSTDYCNGAHGNYQTSIILLGVSLAVIFAKFRWA